MPRRPREHVLETESEIAFRKLIPPTWVIRDVPNDYGIDKEVEIFEDGRATGVMFKVQLKGTDEDFAGKNPAVKVSSSALSYWLKLDSPVLVVLYCSKNNRVYARWAHSFDPHPRKFPKVSTRFKFSPGDRFTNRSYSRIQAELDYVRAFRTRSLSGWVPVRLGASSDVPIDKEQFNFHLTSLVQEINAALVMSSLPDEASIEIEIDKKTLRVLFPAKIASMTIHGIDQRYTGQDGPRVLAADVLLAIGATFANIGLGSQAVDVLSVVPLSSTILKESELGCIIAELLIFSDRLSQALRVLASISDSPVPEVRDCAAQFLGMITMHRRLGDLSSEERVEVLDVLERLAAIEKEVGRPELAGRILYSIAQEHLANRNWSEAHDYFTRALETDQTYELRSYIFRERGGVLYELGELRLAEQDYRRAIELGGSPEVHHLLAILLIELGKYEESASLAKSVPEGTPEFYALSAEVFRQVADTFYSVVGVAAQERKAIPGDVISGLERADLAAEEIIEVMREWDAFDPRLWVLLSHISSDDTDNLHKFMLVAAWILERNSETWVLAIVAALIAEVDELVPQVWKKARLLCDDIISTAEQMIPDMPEEVQETMRDLVYVRSLDPLPRAPRVIRVLNEHNEYVELDAELAYEFLRADRFGF